MARILIIDDDPNVLAMLAALFTKPGNEIVTAQNGSEGVLMAQNSPPDAVIVDLMMPEMNGHQVCANLRSHPATRKIPILMLTAVRELPAAMKGMASGANDFMTKPFQNDEVVARVEALLKRRS